jgi:hypothetical protein
MQFFSVIPQRNCGDMMKKLNIYLIFQSFEQKAPCVFIGVGIWKTLGDYPMSHHPAIWIACKKQVIRLLKGITVLTTYSFN